MAIYRAYCGDKEITDFYIGGKQTKQIWGGNTLLWEKGVLDNPISLGPAVGKKYQNDYVIYKGNSIVSYAEGIYINSSANGRMSGYGEMDSNGVIHYNIFVKSSAHPIITEIKATCEKKTNGKTEFVIFPLDRNYSFKKIKNSDNIYSLTGDYTNSVELSEKDDSGQVIGSKLKMLGSISAGYAEFFYKEYNKTLNDALNFLKK